MRALLTLLLSCLPATSQEGAQEASRDAAAAPAIEAPSFLFLQQPAKGLPMMPAPDGYTPTAPMFELGKRLFHDGILSHDRSVSCATCHPQATGFASAEPLPVGIRGQRARRHAPAIWNRGYGTLQRWDGSSASLEAFVLEPIADHDEMALPLDQALARLTADPDYRRRFEQVFDAPPDRQGLSRALATFVRGIVAGDAPYDRFVRGDATAITQQQRTGQWIFESKGGCWRCHTPPLFTDERFHNTGVGVKEGQPEAGRRAVTGDDADAGGFRTPTLRRVALSAPYMHDGSLPTLESVVDFYAKGGESNPHLDRHVKPIELTADERAALVAFLRSL